MKSIFRSIESVCIFGVQWVKVLIFVRHMRQVKRWKYDLQQLSWIFLKNCNDFAILSKLTAKRSDKDNT